MTHAEMQELLGAYALDAVEPDEAQAIEEHLRTCPRCQAEVEAHRDTASWLAHSGAPAPDGVWDKIAGNLEDTPPPIARVLPWEPRDARRSRSRQRPAITWIAGVAAALVLVLGLVAVNQQRRIDKTDSETALELAYARALRDPGARQVNLQSPDGSVGGTVRAVVLPDGEGYLAADVLDDIGKTRTYQLWGINDERVVSLGVLGSDPGLVGFHAAGDVRTLAITNEVAGGVVQSVNQPVVAGRLST